MKDEFLGLKKSKFLFSLFKNRKGQFAIEAVLLMTVLVGLFLALTQYAQKKEFIKNLVAKPMERVGRMAGYGTWHAECKGNGKNKPMTLGKCHPNSIHRALSSDPK